MKHLLVISSLRTMGDVGNAAADIIETFRREAAVDAVKRVDLEAQLGRSEQRARDQAREIDRLNARLAEAASLGMLN
jgi:pyridoxal/pyridoxine/pyridoxamine kinase